MKKRLIGLMSAVLLAVFPVFASFAAAESALLQKMQKQLNAGSGFKGTVSITGLESISDLNADIRYVLQKAQSQLLIQLKSGQDELVNTALYQQGEHVVLDAGLESGKLYGLPGGIESLFGHLMAGENGGWPIPAYSAIASIFKQEAETDTAKLSEAAAPYITKVDLWMQGFADLPLLEKDELGNSVMNVSYKIPAAAMKVQIKQMLVDLLADEELLPLLWSKMSQEQADLYLNPALKSFYFQAIDALPLSDSVTMKRCVSTAGEHIETTVTLPLAGLNGGLNSFVYTSKTVDGSDLAEITLESDDAEYYFSVQKGAATHEDTQVWQGRIGYQPAKEADWQVESSDSKTTKKAMVASYIAEFTSQLTEDAEGKLKELYALTLALTPDYASPDQVTTEGIRAQYLLTEPASITASLSLLSGQARNAATYVDAQIQYAGGKDNWTLDAQGKTAPPWSFEPVDINASVDVSKMTDDQVNSAITEIVSQPGVVKLLLMLLPADIELPGTVG